MVQQRKKIARYAKKLNVNVKLRKKLAGTPPEHPRKLGALFILNDELAVWYDVGTFYLNNCAWFPILTKVNIKTLSSI
jgi:hypothetical protein